MKILHAASLLFAGAVAGGVVVHLLGHEPSDPLVAPPVVAAEPPARPAAVSDAEAIARGNEVLRGQLEAERAAVVELRARLTAATSRTASAASTGLSTGVVALIEGDRGTFMGRGFFGTERNDYGALLKSLGVSWERGQAFQALIGRWETCRGRDGDTRYATSTNTYIVRERQNCEQIEAALREILGDAGYQKLVINRRSSHVRNFLHEWARSGPSGRPVVMSDERIDELASATTIPSPPAT